MFLTWTVAPEIRMNFLSYLINPVLYNGYLYKTAFYNIFEGTVPSQLISEDKMLVILVTGIGSMDALGAGAPP